MIKMPEVLPSHYIVGIILFTLVMVGGVAFLADLNSVDPTFADQDKFQEFNNTFNKMDDVTSNVDSLQSNIEDADTDFGTFGVLNSLISSGWQTLKLLFSSFGFMTSAYQGISSFFGLPAWVPIFIGMLVTVMLAFAIYAAIFQREI